MGKTGFWSKHGRSLRVKVTSYNPSSQTTEERQDFQQNSTISVVYPNFTMNIWLVKTINTYGLPRKTRLVDNVNLECSMLVWVVYYRIKLKYTNYGSSSNLPKRPGLLHIRGPQVLDLRRSASKP